MNPEQYERARELFLAARELEPEEQAALLGRVRAEDAALCDYVGDLLRRSEADASFLEEPALEGALLDEPTAPIPDRIGSYVVRGLLGEGGMSLVYRAEQENPRRTVALKIIKPGIATASHLRRLEVEAHVLGRLHHPGIACVFEAGTADTALGTVPFFAMELIEGRALDVHAREEELGTRERMKLLARVCDAVQHAHQKGVIHRDLKPANILVDDSGQPKVLDFGVARATDADVQAATLHTGVGQLIGTVPYMSPEQVSGDPDELDTRSDVYALGVVGYELLAKRLPYDVRRSSVAEAARVIRDDDPTPLSSVDRVFRGDLETIFATALEKDKSRRYATAAALAGDLRRYLADEPIVARPPSTSYQLRKFARRNRALVGGATATVLALVAGTVLATWQALVATAEGRRAREAQLVAEDEAAKANEIRELIEGILVAPDPWRDGRQVRVVDLLEKAERDVQASFAARPALLSSLLETLGHSYHALGIYSRAAELTARALELRRGEDPGSAGMLRLEHNLGATYLMQSRIAEAEELLAVALEGRRRLLGPEHEDTLASLGALGQVHAARGRFDDAEELLRECLEACRRRFGEDRRTLQASHTLANALSSMGRLEEAGERMRRNVELAGRILEEDDPLAIMVVHTLGIHLWELGDHEASEPYARRALEAKRRILGEEHVETLNAWAHLAGILRSRGEYAAAREILLGNLATSRAEYGDEHSMTLSIRGNLAEVLRQMNLFDEAEEHYFGVITTLTAAEGRLDPDLLRAKGNLALMRMMQGLGEEAEDILREVLDDRLDALGEDHEETIITRSNLAHVLDRTGQAEEAEKLFRETLASARRALPRDHWLRSGAALDLARLLWKQGRYAEAEEHGRASYEGFRDSFGAADPRVEMALRDLVAICTTWEHDEKAEEYRALLDAAREARAAGGQ